jgi:hypothetical protein
MLLHPNHHFGPQRHDFGFGRVKAEINEYVAATSDATGIGYAWVGFPLHGLAPIIR